MLTTILSFGNNRISPLNLDLFHTKYIREKNVVFQIRKTSYKTEMSLPIKGGI